MNDDWHNKKDFDLFSGGFGVLFAVVSVVGLTVAGVIIWAIISVVNHFT